MAEHAFKVGPITWTVRNSEQTFGYSGGFMKAEIPKSTITGWGVADLSGSFTGTTTEDQDFMGGLGRLVGVGGMGQLLVAHEPRPGKKKLMYINVDFSNPECTALIDALKSELGAKFVGVGPSGYIRKRLGASIAGPVIIALVLLFAIAGVIAWLMR
jgi:hypothetical protein